MIVYALDLATHTGFAVGRAGAPPPRAGLHVLKQDDQHHSVACGNLIEILNREWNEKRPDLVAIEKILNLPAFANMNSSSNSVILQIKLHGIVGGMCERFAIPLREGADSTIRKHFTGKGRAGNRDETKAMVIARCHQLGLMPLNCHDDNIADALAIHDWASATFGGESASTNDLHLFEGRQKNVR